MAYRIYTETNSADTTRDPDDIHQTELCYKATKKLTLLFLKQYISKHFVSKETEVYKTKTGFKAIDFCSYGEVLYAEKVTIEKE